MDIGGACSDRASTEGGAGYTQANVGNTANENGTVSRLQVYAQSNVGGLETGSFQSDGGSDWSLATGYECDGANMSVTSGSCQTLSGGGVDFTSYSADSGHYMGFVHTSGNIEKDTSGGSGNWYRLSDVLFGGWDDVLSFWAGTEFSVYGDDGGGASPDGTQVIRVNITWLMKIFPAAFLFAGLLNNPDLDRRGALNPLNWIRKKAT